MAKIVSFLRDGVESFGVLSKDQKLIADLNLLPAPDFGIFERPTPALELISMGKRGVDVANNIQEKQNLWPDGGVVKLSEVEF